MIIYSRINIFVMFFPFSFFILLVPIGNFCWNFSRQIYFSLTMGTKMVTAWSTAMFWEVFTYLCKCKLLSKLRLNVVWGDSSAPLSVLANMFSWCWCENLSQSSSTYLVRFEISPQWLSEWQPEKVICLIIGYDETLMTSNLFNMHLWMARGSPS